MKASHRSDRLFWVITGAVACVAVGLGLLVSAAAPVPAISFRSSSRQQGVARHRSLAVRRPGGSRFSPQAQIRRRETFARIQGADAFTPLPEPRYGEWLWHFPEEGQTLEDYCDQVVNRKTPSRNTIHVQPFTDLDRVQRKLVERLHRFVAVYFDTQVKLLAPRNVDRRWYDRNHGQLNADLIVRHLAGRVPANSLGLYGLTGSDLYGLGLNFVFGEALLDRRAGIHSIHRFGSSPRLLLRRALKLTAHEMGHLFGLKHCIFYECVMNGTNSLAETDRRPVHLCPVCLAKLQWNLRFEPVERYRKLATLYRDMGLAAESDFVTARSREVAPVER